MERYTMFLDWKNQHCEDDYTAQSNLQSQRNPYQTTNGIFHRTRTKNFTIYMETRKAPNSQSNLEKKKWSWRNQAPCLQTILQSYSNQDSMVLEQNRNIDQWNRIESPESPYVSVTHTHMVTLSLIKEARIYNGEKTASSASGAGKTRQLHVKE